MHRSYELCYIYWEGMAWKFTVKRKSYRVKQQEDEEIITYFWVTYSCIDKNFNRWSRAVFSPFGNG